MLRLMLVTVVASYTMDDDLLGECQVGVGADMSVGRKMYPPIAAYTNHRVDEDISTRRHSRDCVANRIAATVKHSEVNMSQAPLSSAFDYSIYHTETTPSSCSVECASHATL